MLPQLILGGIGFPSGTPRLGRALPGRARRHARRTSDLGGTRQAYSLLLLAIALHGAISIPAIMTADRGNNVGFAVPAFVAFVVSLRRGNYAVTRRPCSRPRPRATTSCSLLAVAAVACAIPRGGRRQVPVLG
jgi:hypothetical protein